jgi:lipid-A-disaccharide synthase
LTVADTATPLRIGIVAAEPSGDLLAAGLMTELRHRLPQVRFEGVAGPRMQREGIDSWAPMEALSVMGLIEVLRDLPRLLRLRSMLLARWREAPPALFIGVDAPDFNLTLEQRLRERGVPTVHYVSPTVWAWRTGRVRKIRRAVDRLLVIFPFEADFLARYGIEARYVGHRLANVYPLVPDRSAARERLGLDLDRPVLAVLPGSRGGELGRIARPFLETAARLYDERRELQCIVPLANEKTRALFEHTWRECCPKLPLDIHLDATRDALAACDVALIASGTATFEGLLSKRPMVVGYRVNPVTFWLVRLLRMVRVEHVAMSNLLAEQRLAPELIQGDCTPDRLLPPLRQFFDDGDRRRAIARQYTEIHRRLRKDTDAEAAAAVVALLRERGVV